MFPARETHCRGGFDIRPGRSRRRGGCGTMRASSPTGVCHRTGFAVSRLAAGLAVGRRGGIYPSRGCLRRRRVRRDEGIPPYGRFIGFAYTGKAACFRREERHVGADSISARGVRGGAGVAGRCEHRPLQGFVIAQGLRFPGWPRALPLVVGEGFIPPAGVCGMAGFPGRCEHRPLQGFVIARRLRFPGWPRALPWFVGEGFIPPAGVCGGADRYGIGPYRGVFYRRVCAFPVGRGPAVGRRGRDLSLSRAFAAARGAAG